MKPFFEFLAGLLFGIGLIVAGMTDPSKVIAFLDVLGSWDPSLAFVMGGAILVSMGAFAWAKKRRHPLLGGSFVIPASQTIDRRLVIGSILFGIGWGIAGFCPGPAIVAVGSGEIKAALFVGAMALGMALFEAIEALRHRSTSA